MRALRPAIVLLLVVAFAPRAGAQEPVGPVPEAPEDEVAGAAEAEVPAPPRPVELRPATVRFRADAPGVRVHYLPDPVLDDASGGGLRVRLPAPSRYDLLCETPCDVQLPQSHYGLAFARDDGLLVRSPEPFGVDGHTGVRVDWADRSAERTAGLLALAIGVPVGLAAGALAIGLDLGTGGDGVAAGVGGAIGSAIVVGSVLAGVILSLSEDGASFSVTPLPDDRSGLFSEQWR